MLRVIKEATAALDQPGDHGPILVRLVALKKELSESDQDILPFAIDDVVEHIEWLMIRLTSTFSTRVTQWAKDRNLIEGSDAQKQTYKLLEEVGELFGGLARGKDEIIKDSIGDIAVVLTILKAQLGAKNYGDSPARNFLDALGSLLSDLASDLALAADCDMALEALMGLTRELGLDYSACCEQAWEEIKDRKGRMVDGVFIKEEDL